MRATPIALDRLDLNPSPTCPHCHAGRTLNPKHAVFVQARVRGAGLADAMRTAGYRGTVKNLSRNGCRLEQRADVQAALARLQARAEDAAVMTKREALIMLSERLRAMDTHSLESFLAFIPRQVGEGKHARTVNEPHLDLSRAKDAKALGALARISVRPDKHGLGFALAFADPVPLVETLAKLQGWYAPAKVEVAEPQPDVAQMSDVELLNELRGMVKDLEAKLGLGPKPVTHVGVS